MSFVQKNNLCTIVSHLAIVLNMNEWKEDEERLWNKSRTPSATHQFFLFPYQCHLNVFFLFSFFLFCHLFHLNLLIWHCVEEESKTQNMTDGYFLWFENVNVENESQFRLFIPLLWILINNFQAKLSIHL